MKKLMGIFAAAAIVSMAAIGMASASQVDAKTPTCKAVAYGARGSAFHKSGNTMSVKFKVTGAKNCKVTISANSFYAPTMNGRPYSKQIVYQRNTKVYKPGVYTASVALPAKSTKAKGCYYQTDLTYGKYNRTPVLAYAHGKLNCNPPKETPPAPKMIKVCDLSSKTIVSIKESDFDSSKYSKDEADCTVVNIKVCDLSTKAIVMIDEKDFDASKYSKDLSDCQETPTPSKMKVCEVKTKDVVTVSEKDYNDNKKQYSKDLDDCKEAPKVEQPKEETPAELPTTGPADVIMKLIGATSIAGAGAYYVTSRRQ